MEPTNKKDEFAVKDLIIGVKDSVVGHLMKGKGRRFAKTILYFLRASEYNGCTVRVIGQAINQADNKGMKIPCTLMLIRQSESVHILSQELKKHVNKPEIVLKESFFLFFKLTSLSILYFSVIDFEASFFMS